MSKIKAFTCPFFANEYARGRHEGEITGLVCKIDWSQLLQDKTGISDPVDTEDVGFARVNRVLSSCLAVALSKDGVWANILYNSIVIVFPDKPERTPELLIDTIYTAVIKSLPEEDTIRGEIPVVGFAHGKVCWRILTYDGHVAPLIEGYPIEFVSEKACKAKPGRVCLGSDVAEIMSVTGRLKAMENGFWDFLPQPADFTLVKPVVDLRYLPFVPEVMRDAGIGLENRSIVIGSLSVNCGEDADQLLSEVFSIVRKNDAYMRTFHREGGRYMSLVLFGVPRATDNIVFNACRFALDLRRSLSSKFRLGLCFNPVQTGFIGDNPFVEFTAMGDGVGFAGKLMSIAQWGEVFINQILHSHSKEDFETDYLADMQFGGTAVKKPVYRLVEKRFREKNQLFETTLVGRDEEMQALEQGFSGVVQGKPGGISVIYGEPGVGKSRLAMSFLQANNTEAIRLNADQTIQDPYHPFLDHFRHFFRQSPLQSAEKNRSTFQIVFDTFLHEIGQIDQDMASRIMQYRPVLAFFLGHETDDSSFREIEGRIRNKYTQNALLAYLMGHSILKPLVLLVEDMQWLDPETHQLIELVAKHQEQCPIYVIGTCRYDGTGNLIRFQTRDNTPVREIHLRTLNEHEACHLVQEILHAFPDANTMRQIMDITGGNPLFIEHYARFLDDRGYLHHREGGVRISGSPDETPFSLVAILSAQFDRLGLSLKTIAKVASAIGKEFDSRVLLQIVRMDVDDDLLPLSPDDLDEEGFAAIIRMGALARLWVPRSGSRFMFEHILLQQSIYDMIPLEIKHQLHGRIARALEVFHQEDKTQWHTLAEHHYRSGNLIKARDVFRWAGEFNRKVYNLRVAALCFKRYLDLALDTFPGDSEQLAEAYYQASLGLYDIQQDKEALTYADKSLQIRIALHGEEHITTADSYYALGIIRQRQMDTTSPMQYFYKALEIRVRERGEKHESVADLQNIIANNLLYLQTDQSIELYNKVISIYSEIFGENHEKVAFVMNNLAVAHLQSHRMTEALSILHQALRVMDSSYPPRHPTRALICGNIGFCYQLIGNYAEAEKYNRFHFEYHSETFTDQTDSLAECYLKFARIYIPWFRLDDAKVVLDKALQVLKAQVTPNLLMLVETMSTYANMYINNWEFGKAETIYREVLQMLSEKGGDHPEYIRVQGQTHAHLADIHSRAGNFREALTELRVSNDLNRKWKGEDHPTVNDNTSFEALLLAELYEYEESLELAKRSLAQMVETMGDDALSTGYDKMSLGIICCAMGDMTSAEHYYNDAFNIYDAYPGQHLPQVNMLRKFWINFLLEMDRVDFTLDKCLTFLAESCRENGENDPCSISYLQKLAAVYLRKGDHLQARAYLNLVDRYLSETPGKSPLERTQNTFMLIESYLEDGFDAGICEDLLNAVKPDLARAHHPVIQRKAKLLGGILIWRMKNEVCVDLIEIAREDLHPIDKAEVMKLLGNNGIPGRSLNLSEEPLKLALVLYTEIFAKYPRPSFQRTLKDIRERMGE